MGNAPKVTVPDIKARKGGPRLTMITAYDLPSARIADAAGVDIVLVGDSVANVVHGMSATLTIDLDTMILHAAAVKRSDIRPLLVVDMPWLTFHVSAEDTVRNAGRLVREGGAEAVKIEGGRRRVAMVEALIAAEIPVMGHLGLTPQSVNSMGGYKVQGKLVDDARELINDAMTLDEAGIFALVLEGVPDVVAEIITKEISVPTIGIGAGPATDGQVLVFHDIVGLSFGHQPKFVRRFADLGTEAIAAVSAFRRAVETGEFPSEDETYHLADEVEEALLKEWTT
ncbi:MAG TPA: 3-methyl-2-oxobutanoate hydroxymethyltransferase [Acidimicrobiia bacterium]|jgi:3-methyl-2-oxobutanoate hydroxymethyltransferase